MTDDVPMQVFFTGSAGRTGRLVAQILKDNNIKVTGLIRRKEQQAEVPGETILGDIRKPETFQESLKAADALIILSSAMPQKKEGGPPGPPQFFYAEGQSPEEVDWIGQKNQIDAAKDSNVKHVILIGSMGSTREDHMLNRIGNGNILVWKRKSEQYLIDSGLPYTVINPGGLLDKPGGERELLVGRADEYLDTATRAVPRADLAEVVYRSLLQKEARNKAFDLVSKEGGSPPADWQAFFAQTQSGL